jgi:hypothetical protein
LTIRKVYWHEKKPRRYGGIHYTRRYYHSVARDGKRIDSYLTRGRAKFKVDEIIALVGLWQESTATSGESSGPASRRQPEPQQKLL